MQTPRNPGRRQASKLVRKHGSTCRGLKLLFAQEVTDTGSDVLSGASDYSQYSLPPRRLQILQGLQSLDGHGDRKGQALDSRIYGHLQTLQFFGVSEVLGVAEIMSRRGTRKHTITAARKATEAYRQDLVPASQDGVQDSCLEFKTGTAEDSRLVTLMRSMWIPACICYRW